MGDSSDRGSVSCEVQFYLRCLCGSFSFESVCVFFCFVCSWSYVGLDVFFVIGLIGAFKIVFAVRVKRYFLYAALFYHSFGAFTIGNFFGCCECFSNAHRIIFGGGKDTIV